MPRGARRLGKNHDDDDDLLFVLAEKTNKELTFGCNVSVRDGTFQLTGSESAVLQLYMIGCNLWLISHVSAISLDT